MHLLSRFTIKGFIDAQYAAGDNLNLICATFGDDLRPLGDGRNRDS